MEFERAKVLIDAKKLEDILEKLREPFDPDCIFWKPQAVNKAKDRAVAAAYADPRAYQDRLNEVVGPNSWGTTYQVIVIPPQPGPDPKDWKNRWTYKGKVFVVATVSIDGLGFHSDTGESDVIDENSITSASAQAFKRAVVQFGVGRYLYDLPKNQWVAYDDTTKRITEPPELPEWAIPKKHCVDCSAVIIPYQHGDKVISITEIIANGQRKYHKQLCAECQKKLSPVAPKPPAHTGGVPGEAFTKV
jgi:hypothetical protein